MSPQEQELITNNYGVFGMDVAKGLVALAYNRTFSTHYIIFKEPRIQEKTQQRIYPVIQAIHHPFLNLFAQVKPFVNEIDALTLHNMARDKLIYLCTDKAFERLTSKINGNPKWSVLKETLEKQGINSSTENCLHCNHPLLQMYSKIQFPRYK